MKRETGIKNLSDSTKTWDIIVIGGGASGLGAAVDAAARGYSTLLLEKYDFAKGTSSRSTKLIHGGVRYLAQGDIALDLGSYQVRSNGEQVGAIGGNCNSLTVANGQTDS